MLIERKLEKTILEALDRNKIIVLLEHGKWEKPRSSGKYLEVIEMGSLEIQGDQAIYKEAFSQSDFTTMLEVEGFCISSYSSMKHRVLLLQVKTNGKMTA